MQASVRLAAYKVLEPQTMDLAVPVSEAVLRLNYKWASKVSCNFIKRRGSTFHFNFQTNLNDSSGLGIGRLCRLARRVVWSDGARQTGAARAVRRGARVAQEKNLLRGRVRPREDALFVYAAQRLVQTSPYFY